MFGSNYDYYFFVIFLLHTVQIARASFDGVHSKAVIKLNFERAYEASSF